MVIIFEVCNEVQVIKKHLKNIQLVTDEFCEFNREQGFKFIIQSVLLTARHFINPYQNTAPQVSIVISQSRWIGIRPQKSIFPLIESILSFSTGISEMTITVPCGCGDSGKKRYLKAIVVQTVRIYTNYSALSLVPETYMPCIETHMPKTFLWKSQSLCLTYNFSVSAFVLGDHVPKFFIKELKFVSGL